MIIVGVCFWITTKCNLRCNICYADLNSVADNKLEGYLAILEKLREFDIKKIAFTGGEPLLVPSLDEILIRAKGMRFKVALTTNAILLDRPKLGKIQHFVDEISIPMDGFTKKTLSLHRTDKHQHENVLNIIRSSKDYDIKFDVSTVLTKHNKSEIFDILNFLESNGIYKWKVFQYSLLNRSEDMNIDFTLPEDSFLEIQSKIYEHISNNNYSIQVDFRNNSSSSINSYINILPNGKLLLSDGNNYVDAGNIMNFSNYNDFLVRLIENDFSFEEHKRRHVRDI